VPIWTGAAVPCLRKTLYPVAAAGAVQVTRTLSVKVPSLAATAVGAAVARHPVLATAAALCPCGSTARTV